MRVNKTAFWILFALTLANYFVMLFWSLPALQSMAGGELAFDLRLTGYSFEEAKTLLAALGIEGAEFYSNIQHKLDFTYPLLLALTLGLSILLLTPSKWGIWRYVLAAIAIPGAVFDFLENAAVSSMLELGPEGINAQLVSTANQHTLLKGQFTTAAMLVVLTLLGLWGWRKYTSRKTA